MHSTILLQICSLSLHFHWCVCVYTENCLLWIILDVQKRKLIQPSVPIIKTHGTSRPWLLLPCHASTSFSSCVVCKSRTACISIRIFVYLTGCASCPMPSPLPLCSNTLFQAAAYFTSCLCSLASGTSPVQMHSMLLGLWHPLWATLVLPSPSNVTKYLTCPHLIF